MYQQRMGARAEHRKQEAQRVCDSATLADRFTELKSLTVDVAFYTPGGKTRTRQYKYTVNIDNAKSVFRLDCPNNECVCGDFDLSDAVADAVVSGQAGVHGEITCQGWRSKTTIDTVHCQTLLRYTMHLGY